MRESRRVNYAWYQVRSGTYAFTSGVVVAWMSPPRLLMMWGQFATTFRSSLSAIMLVPGRAVVFGGLGGPIAFWAGERWGADEGRNGSWAMCIVKFIDQT